MGQWCNLRSIVTIIVAVEIVFMVLSVLLSIDPRRLRNGLSTTPSPSDVSTVDYDNDSADEFLINYSIYCEKFLRPHILNTQHRFREKSLCPCIPNHLGLCFVCNIW